MLKYAAIDVETTGLDPQACQVIELAIVAETDWVTPVGRLPYLHLFVEHDEYRGSAEAIHMNRRAFEELARPPELREGATVPALSILPWGVVGEFLDRHFGKGETVTAAGKNYATFDARFLEKLPGWPSRRIRHRVLDPGSMWVDLAADDRLPDTKECLKRAGVSNNHPHHPLYDCYAVIEMIRAARLVSARAVA